MISINCTNCNTRLDIDDAFAGGVCRCQHCGAIQTVPTKKNAAVATAKTLYSTKPRGGVDTGGSGTGIEALGEIVASSGLARSGLTRSAQAASVDRGGKPAGKKQTLILVIAGVVICALVAVIVFLVARSGSDAPPAGTVQTPTPAGARTPVGPAPVADANPKFAGVPLTGNVIVYVLDRGSSSRDIFGYVKEATYRSIQSLGADRKFQIVFWDNASTDASAYPTGLPAYATAENLTAARRALEDVSAYGQSDATPALKKAAAANAGEIVITTAKGPDFNEDEAKHLLSLLGSSKPKITAIALGAGESDGLKFLADHSNGQYKTVSEGDLKGE